MSLRYTVKSPNRWIVIHPENGDRLCQDFKWRHHAPFGTYPECVKVYRYMGNARKTARRFNVNGKNKIIGLDEDQTMDASGNIFNQPQPNLLFDPKTVEPEGFINIGV